MKPCDCVHLCAAYTQSGTEYADDVETMHQCPHFKAQPNPNHGQIKFIGHDGHETTYPPAGIATVCGRCKADCQSVAHSEDHGWICDDCLLQVYG